MASTGAMTLVAGALSTPLAVTQNSVFTVSFTGPDFTVMRSVDGGSSFQPLARDQSGAICNYRGPLSIDFTEARSGVQYAITTNSGGVGRIDQ